MAQRYEKILVKVPNWVGDALLATPALNSLGRAFPDSEITVLAAPWVAPVLETHPAVKRLWLYDPKGEHRPLGERLRVIGRLRAEGFDLALLLPNSLHAALLSRMAGIPHRIGYEADGRAPLLTRSLPRDESSKGLHQAEYYLELVRLLGVEVADEDKALRLEVTAADREWASSFIAERGIDASPLLAALHPGAVKAGKRWPWRRFAALAKWLIEELGAHILLLGSKNEGPLLEQVKEEAASPRLTPVSGATIRQAAALLRRCRIFVGNDSGLMHLSTAVGTPPAVIFGPGTPRTTAPYSHTLPYVVIMREFACRPCRQRFFTECRPSAEGAPPCLDQVETGEVRRGVEELLERSRGYSRR